jgi:hypothetical protein
MNLNRNHTIILLTFVIGLVSCRQAPSIEQYDLVPSEGVTIVQAKTNSYELTEFITRLNSPVFSLYVDLSTGTVTLHVKAPSEFTELVVDCDTASIEYGGKAYKTLPNPEYSERVVQPVKCRAGQVVDGFQTDLPHTYAGAASIEFRLPAPVSGPMVVTLPSVFMESAGADGPKNLITVKYQPKKFVEGGGWH